MQNNIYGNNFVYTLYFPIILILLILYKKMPYQYLLEFPNKYYYGLENINNIDDNNELIIKMKQFCEHNNIYNTGAIVSLSGGIDSMVVLACLLHLRKTNNFSIYVASINYNQRNEQKNEIDFLKDYCLQNNVILYSTTVENYTRKKADSGSRTEFEEESKKIRFDLYKKIITENKCLGVFIGHHKDDTIENIFTNSMKGCNILNLEVIKEINKIHDVNIFRPFLNFHKSVIFDFAHKYNIPYFLDTTPKWSRRGRMRFEIFKLLDDVFTPSWRLKLKNLGDQSSELGNYIEDYVIKPWFNEVIIKKYGFIIPIKNQPKLIYKNIIMKCMHTLGKHMLNNKSINKIMDNLINYNKYIILDSGFMMYIDENYKNNIIIFNKDEIQEHINNHSCELNNYDMYCDEKQAPYFTDYYNNDKVFEYFINGYIRYIQPKNAHNKYTLNNYIYSRMFLYSKDIIFVPLNILQLFIFIKLSDETTWITTDKK